MEAVREYLRRHQTRFIEELCDYLRFASISTQSERKSDLVACVDWMVEHCRSIGFETRVVRTSGNPVILASTRRRTGYRHFVVYGHYDVQPPQPLEEWTTAPFEPSIRDGFIYSRGASDNKGQHFAHIKGVEAFINTGTELPCDITVVLEGEEEIGSPSLPAFIAAHHTELSCDAIVISDTTIPSLQSPGVTCSLRGLVSAEVRVVGPNRDLHSGIYGGAVENPAFALCQILACCRDEHGNVTIPGVTDDIRPLTPEETKDLERINIDESSYCHSLGISTLIDGHTREIPARTTARPSFEINGLAAGYSGEGIKTVIPSEAIAKVSMRLVANQDPAKMFQALKLYLNEICPPGVRLSVSSGFLAEPYSIAPTNPWLLAALNALRVSFGCEPLRLREGVSIPLVALAKRILSADSLLLGLALPEDRPHAPNERFSLAAFCLGQHMSAELWKSLGAI